MNARATALRAPDRRRPSTVDPVRPLIGEAPGTTPGVAGEADLGHDFSSVPIHARPTGAQAADGLMVGPSHDDAEREAERLAAMVGTGTRRGPVAQVGDRPSPVIRRQGTGGGTAPATTPAPGSREGQAAAAKAAADKLAKDQLDKMMSAALADAATKEPLKGMIARGKAFAATPAGIVAITTAVTSLITASVLTHQELPVTSYKFDLGMLSKDLEGISITPTWKGPANAPTEAGVKVELAPKGSPISITEGFKTGSNTPNTLEAGIGIKPGGALAGVSLTAGVTVADRPSPLGPLDLRRPGATVSGSFGLAYAPKSGPAAGFDFSGKATFDNAGNNTVVVGVGFSWGGASTKRKPAGEVQRAPEAGATSHAGPAAPSVYRVLGEPGTSLPADLRADMGRALGADFSGVRVHADHAAAASAADIGARAYTVGSHVVFGTGLFDPGCVAGQRLLAHELVHVIQQGAAPRRTGR